MSLDEKLKSGVMLRIHSVLSNVKYIDNREIENVSTSIEIAKEADDSGNYTHANGTQYKVTSITYSSFDEKAMMFQMSENFQITVPFEAYKLSGRKNIILFKGLLEPAAEEAKTQAL